MQSGEWAFAEVAEVIPGFAGYYFDDPGWVVRLTDTTVTAVAQEVVAEDVSTHFPVHPSSGPDTRPIRVDPAEFAFLDLAWWHHLLMEEVGPEQGVAWSDLSESENRIVIAVLPESLDEFVETLPDLIGRLGIDNGAVITIAGRRAVFDVGSIPAASVEEAATGKTLSFIQRPLQGGYGIGWKDDTGHEWPCTIGIVTWHNSRPSFVTNTHCSRDFGKDEATPYFQPFYVAYEDRSVGTESHDPDWFRCNWVFKCRMADANIVSFEGTYSDIDHGRIARTLDWNGSTEIDPDKPYFTIIGAETYVAEGYIVHKIGATSGWTRGEVTRTCLTSYIDLPHKEETVRINCVDEASYGRTGGDSGGPVFTRWGSDDVIFWGIHHAGHADTGYGLFSRNSRVQEELGGVSVYPSTPSDPGGGGDDCTDGNGDPIPC